MDQGRPCGRVSFAVVQSHGGRSLARELRESRDVVVLQVAPPEYCILAGRVAIVVNACNVSVPGERRACLAPESGRVVAIAQSIVVRRRISMEWCADGGLDAD